MKENKKQKYIYALTCLEDGFLNIPIGIKDLVTASNILLEEKAFAPSLSLSVIALEECGKLFILDSLLFLRDKRNNYFKKKSISHKDKLDALQFCIPLFINISKHDKNFRNPQTKEQFEKAIQIGMKNLHLKYVELREQLPNSDFRELDILKQKGFYSDHSNNAFNTPSSNVDITIANKVNELANSFVNNMTFILNKGAIDGYISMAKSIRGKLSQEDWVNISVILDINQELESIGGTITSKTTDKLH